MDIRACFIVRVSVPAHVRVYVHRVTVRAHACVLGGGACVCLGVCAWPLCVLV